MLFMKFKHNYNNYYNIINNLIMIYNNTEFKYTDNEVFNKTLFNLLKGSLITNDQDILTMSNYGLDEYDYENKFPSTSSEQLSKMIDIDYANAFTSTLALAISDLIDPGLIEELIEKKLDVSEEITNNQSSNTCNNFVLICNYLIKLA